MMPEFTEILKQYGPWIALVLFFVWQSWVREGKLGDQLNEVQKFIRETMSVVIRDNTEAMVGWRELLKQRPCLLEDVDKIDPLKPHKEDTRHG
jgi:hypothetical protein